MVIQLHYLIDSPLQPLLCILQYTPVVLLLLLRFLEQRSAFSLQSLPLLVDVSTVIVGYVSVHRQRLAGQKRFTYALSRVAKVSQPGTSAGFLFCVCDILGSTKRIRI